MSGIIYAVVLFALIAAILLYRLIKLRREIRSISSQLEALVAGDTEKMLDITFVDKELERLAGLFNQYNDRQRMLVAGAMKDEQFLKDSVANISHDLRTPLTVILGHLQRGGTPSAYDRILASRLGYASIEALMEGQRNIMVGISNDEIVYVPIQRAIKMDKPINKELIDVLSVLSM